MIYDLFITFLQLDIPPLTSHVLGLLLFLRGGWGVRGKIGPGKATNAHLLFCVPNSRGLEATKLCDANLAFVDNTSFKHIFTLHRTGSM